MTRNHLPQRRPSLTHATTWDGHEITVTIGLYLDGTPGEVFADVAKGALRATLADACTVISIALQHGISPGDLAKSIGKVPVMEWTDGAMVEVERPASPIGAVLDVLRDYFPPRAECG